MVFCIYGLFDLEAVNLTFAVQWQSQGWEVKSWILGQPDLKNSAHKCTY